MNYIKFGLVFIVLLGIGISIYNSGCGRTPPPDSCTLRPNPFVVKINAEIDTLKQPPINEFRYIQYSRIRNLINQYYRDGDFGKDSLENSQNKENLATNLFAAYCDVFIAQCTNVFADSTWSNSDLNIIKREIKEIKSHHRYNEPSEVASSLSEFERILEKYYEVNDFIIGCKKFKYTSFGFDDYYPIFEVDSLIKQSNLYLENDLNYSPVNNCIRIKKSLMDVPQILFRKHVEYLENKINTWSNMYSNFGSFYDYNQTLYESLKYDINVLNNTCYRNVNIDIQQSYDRLYSILNNDRIKAQLHPFN